ncbi:glycosyltransferase [Stutzerimonas nitrititolerans]|uniref:glycosyltransferase n=1 Tax=Stutzerimonas nitrititolerans TaxID=2482751 RepID=UPI0028B0BD71|nr:glycosyltransferase [Stutzerimonas nitrititolerans]
MSPSDTPRVLQLCHGYDGPFLDCARQYAVLFAGTPYRVTTVFLTGVPDERVAAACASDEVLFLGYSSKEVGGLKLGAMRRLREIIRGRDFRLCIAHRFKPAYIACVATRLPVIGVNHAFDVYQRFSRRIFANLFRKRLLLLGVSNAVRDDIRACLPSWPAERIETLYNRIDVEAVQAEQITREGAREHLGLPLEAWVVGNVGRLHPDKDQATLIRAFAQALPKLPPNSLLAIVGGGRLETTLKTLASELGISDSVCFLGQIPNARRYFKAFDAFALSSDHEPFGMVLLEAMAAGLPVVCSDCGGGREVIESVGSLFPFRDENALASQLEQMSNTECSVYVTEQRLRQHFTDDVAKIHFWKLASSFLPSDSIAGTTA